MTVTCATCGEGFDSPHSGIRGGRRARYCTRACADVGHRKPRNPCPMCGRMSKRAVTRYCSPECSQASMGRAVGADGRPRPMTADERREQQRTLARYRSRLAGAERRARPTADGMLPCVECGARFPKHRNFRTCPEHRQTRTARVRRGTVGLAGEAIRTRELPPTLRALARAVKDARRDIAQVRRTA